MTSFWTQFVYTVVWSIEIELFTPVLFSQVSPGHAGWGVPWARRASGASQARAPPGRTRRDKPLRKLIFMLQPMEEWWLFHRICWSTQQTHSPLAVKINRQPCPSLPRQQLFPNTGSKVIPILPSGPHEAHSLIHIIRDQPSQKVFYKQRYSYICSH